MSYKIISQKNSLYKIKNIINDIDLKKNKDLYENTKHIMPIIEEFIIRKKFLLYGGLAINLLLKNKDKFYKKYTLNDYDCFSYNAKNDAYELADILYKNGFKYVEVRKAVHQNTFRIYVNFIQLLDLTHIPKNIFVKLFNISLQERKSVLYKYYSSLIYPF